MLLRVGLDLMPALPSSLLSRPQFSPHRHFSPFSTAKTSLRCRSPTLSPLMASSSTVEPLQHPEKLLNGEIDMGLEEEVEEETEMDHFNADSLLDIYAEKDARHLPSPEVEVIQLEDLPDQWKRSRIAWLCKELPAHRQGTLVRILNAQRKWIRQGDATYVTVHCMRIRENEAAYRAEVIFLGQLRHPHLVKLIGYCCEDEERLLVYEFMPRGSLENHLFKRISASLSWGTRMKIATGAAKGLAFLHGAEKPIIYRDFKTSNILLDSDFTAKLSDFGLAKMGPSGEDTHVSTRVMGTQGYAAPEYVMTGHLTTKNDVYSFGVVLLELLTGRRSVDKSRPKKEEKLVEWTKPYLRNSRKLRCIMDPKLAGQYSVKCAREAAALALRCISPHPKDRPQMTEVVNILQGQDLRAPAPGRKVMISTSPRFAGHRRRTGSEKVA